MWLQTLLYKDKNKDTSTLTKKKEEETSIKRLDAEKYIFLVIFCVAMMTLGFVFNTPSEIFDGMVTIFRSPSILLTDYIEISSMGATFFNAGLTTLLSVLMIFAQKVKLSGPLLAAVFTVFGFAMFGKNLFNTIPITLGVFLFSRIMKRPFSHYLIPSLFGTALGPAISSVAFGLGFPLIQGILIGYALGIFIGLILPPLSAHYLSFHQGFSVYNMGFTAGIVGMGVAAFLGIFDIHFDSVAYLSSGNNLKLSIVMFTFSAVLIIMGMFYNGKSFKGYTSLLKHSGKLISDFVQLEGIGKTYINMGIQGILTTALILILGGELNGPVLGGIFTVIGFSAFGKHPMNCFPVIFGVIAASLPMSRYTTSTGVLLAMLFGTTLAPIAGFYGAILGFVAGFIHMSVVVNVGFLHFGMNLYNNGFAGGFVAAILVPIFDAVRNLRKEQ